MPAAAFIRGAVPAFLPHFDRNVFYRQTAAAALTHLHSSVFNGRSVRTPRSSGVPGVRLVPHLLLSAKVSRIWKYRKRLWVRLYIFKISTFLFAEAEADKKVGKGLRRFGKDTAGGERNVGEPVNKEKKRSGS